MSEGTPYSRLFLRTLAFGRRTLRPLTLGVRALVIDEDGAVFLVRHGYTPGWYLPGGAVEPGETAAQALARELMEEGGIALTAPPILFGLYHNAALGGRDHVALYRCPGWYRARVPKRGFEIVEHGFFPREGLPQGTTDATRRRLAEIFDGAAIAETW